MAIEPRRAIQQLQPERPSSADRAGKIRLDMNENTRGAAPSVVRALRSGLDGKSLARYPEYETSRSALAQHFKVSPHELLLTNGIDDALKLICDTFVDPGDTLLIPALTFPMYQFFHSMAGGRIAPVPYDETLRLPLDGVLAALRRKRDRPRWLALANPNNPTGTLVPKDEITAILRAAPGTLVLIDEAYFDYSGETVLPWIPRFPNLVVSRTFSKAHGLAGLRLGLLFARRELTRWMRRAQAVFPVNGMALAAAVEAIRDPDPIRRHVEEVLANRARLCRCLDSLGAGYAPSRSNFVFVSFGKSAARVTHELAVQGILVRHWSAVPHLSPYVRIGVGTASETRRLIRALEGIRSLIRRQKAESIWEGAARYSPLAGPRSRES